MTAGNSTPLTDGASVVLLASEAWAKQHGLPVLGYLTQHETAAVDYVHGAEGLLMAPAYAMPRMLARAKLTLQDFDFYEIHEAFASQVHRHPEGVGGPDLLPASGSGSTRRWARSIARSSTSPARRWRPGTRSRRPVAGSSPRLATLLAERGEGRGVISICAAGGQGVTAIVERP